jgi:hypothetical protein
MLAMNPAPPVINILRPDITKFSFYQLGVGVDPKNLIAD